MKFDKLLPTSTVGSFEKPDYLRRAQVEFKKGKITAADLLSKQEKAVKEIIELQERIGLDILVDGEMARGEMTVFFGENFGGMEISDWVRSYGNRYYRKPIVKSAIKWEKPITVDIFRFAQNLTDKPVKGMFTGPYTMLDWSFDEYYGDRREAVLAFAREYRREAEELKKAGCQILQIDEPAASVRMDEWPLVAEALEIITKDLGMYTICHICYGEFEKIEEKHGFSILPVDNLDLEFANSNFRVLDFFKGKNLPQDIAAGVFDVHTHQVPSVDTIVKNIEKIMALFPSEKLWIKPDCGLRTRTMAEAEESLKNMVEATEIVRGRLD